MSWVRIDDGFDDHPKTLKLSPFALALHIRALCWCNRHLTDGRVPFEAIHRLGVGLFDEVNGAEHDWPERPVQIADELVLNGQWESVDDGWLIHDYLDYNPSREQVERERDTVREQRRKAGIQSGLARRTARSRSVQHKANGTVASPLNPVPSRPDPNPGRSKATTDSGPEPVENSRPAEAASESPPTPGSQKGRAGPKPTQDQGEQARRDKAARTRLAQEKHHREESAVGSDKPLRLPATGRLNQRALEPLVETAKRVFGKLIERGQKVPADPERQPA